VIFVKCAKDARFGQGSAKPRGRRGRLPFRRPPTPDLASGPDEPQGDAVVIARRGERRIAGSLNGASMARTYDRRGPKGPNGLGQETR
jgi:hypothetical protein